MFNWFDKLLVKIAKKILNKYAPTGEFIAYINEREEKVLKDLGGYGQPINETGIKSFLSLGEIWENTQEFFTDNADTIIKVGGGLGKAYIDMSDQERKNVVTEKAYNDYMKQVEAAGKEAEAAVATNLTPMTISNVPTTKADVSDFTAVAARGGLMNLPTKQRKKYAYQGFVQDDDIEIMEPESLGDFELQKEEGVNIGEQVFHDSGDDRTNAQNVWQSGQIDQQLYDMNFELFFNSRDWEDHISRGTVQGDTQMASDPSWEAEWDDIYENYKAKQISAGQEFVDKETFMMQYQDNMAHGGIAGLRHGGRPGYQFGVGPQQGMMPQGMMPQGMMPQQGLRPGYNIGKLVDIPRTGEEFMTEEEVSRSNPGNAEMYEQEIIENQPSRLEVMDSVIIMTADGMKTISKEDYAKVMSGEMTTAEALENAGYQDNLKKIETFKKGGRVKYAQGSGIMDLGGLEKDYRTTGGFVPIGGRERADDVPARLSKNEFVMTADAVRAAGGGSINKGAQRMYDTMKHLEASPQSNRMIS
jgi:hypothetical protein